MDNILIEKEATSGATTQLFNLTEANQAIRVLLDDLNQRPFVHPIAYEPEDGTGLISGKAENGTNQGNYRVF